MLTQQSLYEINHRAISVLCQEIGIVNTLRFIRQFSTGYGNYTEEREAIFKEKSLEDILGEIKMIRESKK
ncbi:MAG: hypothetical protein R2830_08640 [Saprospiraceae bacterium]